MLILLFRRYKQLLDFWILKKVFLVNAIQTNNAALDQVMKLAAVAGETPTDLNSVFYITPPAQREVAPVGTGSTMTPETEAYLRTQGLLDD